MSEKRRSSIGSLGISTSSCSDDSVIISEKELSECDREKLHLVGNVQDGAGHVFFFSHPEGEILAADMKVRDVPFIRNSRRSETERAARPDAHAMPPPRKKRMQEGGERSDESDEENKTETEAKDARLLLGAKVEDCIPATLMSDIVEAVETMRRAKSQRTFRFFTFEEQSYAISVSSTTDEFLIVGVEIEEMEEFEATDNLYNTLVSLGRVMEFYADKQILNTACDTVFKLLEGYDRGMVYKFNDDLSGEVVHEIKKDGIPSSYLGMRFPAADIPLPARKLYIKNGLRYIQNVNAGYNAIVDNGNREIDLSNCRMRAVARPHIVYMRNMGVMASLSIAIVVEKELWGLLAFHGYNKPYKPSLHQRIACESIMSMVNVKVESLMRKAESARVIELSESLIRWEHSHSVAHNLNHNSKGLLHVFDADVLAARIVDPLKEEHDFVVLGDKSLAPKDDDNFWNHFKSYASRELVAIHIRQGITDIGLSEEVCPASGMVYFQDGLVQVMLGRGTRGKDVRWAGKPDEPKLRIGGILCPRNSFDMFMEKARKETRAWSATDLNVITTFMDRVCEHSHNRNATLLKSDIEDANQKYFDALERSEDNCQFFAQMSHELRTPFHGVMGSLNILNDSIQDMPQEEVQEILNNAMSSGNHMINLLNDILSISKDRHLSNALTLEPVKLGELASEPTGNLMKLATSKKIVMKYHLPSDQTETVVITDKKKVMQVISNIVNNGIKFTEGGNIDISITMTNSMIGAVNLWAEAASSYAGTVYTMIEDEILDSVEGVRTKVMQHEDKKDRWILASVLDSGCGMKPGELGEMLKPYTQSSKGSNRAFQGTGLGLFICVSLCHQLGGFIACSSTPGVGSIFHIGIPVDLPESRAAGAASDVLPPQVVVMQEGS